MQVEITKSGVLIDGKEVYLAGGDIHYYRILPQGWRRRLELAKDFGLTAVQTYVPWHLHEKKEGEFDFSGHLNLAAFLELCKEMGLYVMLRPSPHITSECDLGGIPAWVYKDETVHVRCADPHYLACIEKYYARLCPEFVPYLATNGGPIIAVAIENEYGSFADDKKYLHFLRDTLVKNGVDVPFYTTDGAGYGCLAAGKVEGAWSMANCGPLDAENGIKLLKEFQPDKPPMIGEFWPGGNESWGSVHWQRPVEPVAEGYRKALEAGAFVNFYMFSGGTNFGLTAGLHFGVPFPRTREDGLRMFNYVTSYNVYAPVSEWGDTTPLYYALRKELDEYLGRPVRTEKVPDVPRQRIENVKLTKSAGLFDSLEVLSEKTVRQNGLCTMDSLGQSFGYILYSTEVKGIGKDYEPTIMINGLRDLALIFVDGKYVGTYLRDEAASERGTLKIKVPAEGCHLDILVENMGRPDAGAYISERKGILDGVHLSGLHQFDWEIRTLPMWDVSGVLMRDYEKKETPAFYKGTFRAEEGVDTFLDTKGLTKGAVWINGFNIGKYWDLGPQRVLYVPGELLKEDNEIVVFEMFEAEGTVQFTDTPVWYEENKDHPFFEAVNKMQ